MYRTVRPSACRRLGLLGERSVTKKIKRKHEGGTNQINDNYQQSIFDNTEQSTLENSLRLIRGFEDVALHRHPFGYVVGYSGGKDSEVLVDLFRRAGVKFLVMHNHTTLDAPETVYHVRRKFSEWTAEGIPCKIYYPRQSFWTLCKEKKMLPNCSARFCCEDLKEYQIPELRFATRSFGVRKAEGVKRAKLRDSIETRNRVDYADNQRFHFDDTESVRQMDACYRNNFFIVNPLAYWTDNELWNYIHGERLEINPLYNHGFKRIGCIGCPLARKHRTIEFEMYPKYKENYIRLCEEIWQERRKRGMKNYFKTGREYFEFWLNDNRMTQTKPLLELAGV